MQTRTTISITTSTNTLEQLFKTTHSYQDYKISYEEYKKSTAEHSMKSLNKIFEISNNKDLNDLNYSTNCFGLCKYDTSALYSRGIKTSNNDVLNRYEDYSPPTSCCGVLL